MCYLADGFFERWLANIGRLRTQLPNDSVFRIGHGGPVSRAAWDWHRGYIERFIEAVTKADWSDPAQAQAAVVARMKDYLPAEELQFLMELSIEPVAAPDWDRPRHLPARSTDLELGGRRALVAGRALGLRFIFERWRNR